MSDGADAAEPYRASPSSLAVYATCPRQYEYDKIWDVATPEESRRYLDRGLVYHGVIEDTCEEVADDPDLSDEEIRNFARQRTVERWDRQTSRSEYVSDAQYAYDQEVVLAAIASYFADEGIEHVRNSIGTELDLECERNDVHLKGRADNVVRTDDGLHVIDYKGSLNGIVSWQSAGDIPAHREGDEYVANILKSVFQAAIYIEGAKNLPSYEPGMDLEFTFYSLLYEKTREGHVDGIQVDVRGRGREVGSIYREYEDDIWALIEEMYRGIVDGDYEPVRFEDIREHACKDCEYYHMCGDYLGEEVRFHD